MHTLTFVEWFQEAEAIFGKTKRSDWFTYPQALVAYKQRKNASEFVQEWLERDI